MIYFKRKDPNQPQGPIFVFWGMYRYKSKFLLAMKLWSVVIVTTEQFCKNGFSDYSNYLKKGSNVSWHTKFSHRNNAQKIKTATFLIFNYSQQNYINLHWLKSLHPWFWANMSCFEQLLVYTGRLDFPSNTFSLSSSNFAQKKADFFIINDLWFTTIKKWWGSQWNQTIFLLTLFQTSLSCLIISSRKLENHIQRQVRWVL